MFCMYFYFLNLCRYVWTCRHEEVSCYVITYWLTLDYHCIDFLSKKSSLFQVQLLDQVQGHWPPHLSLPLDAAAKLLRIFTTVTTQCVKQIQWKTFCKSNNSANHLPCIAGCISLQPGYAARSGSDQELDDGKISKIVPWLLLVVQRKHQSKVLPLPLASGAAFPVTNLPESVLVTWHLSQNQRQTFTNKVQK